MADSPRRTGPSAVVGTTTTKTISSRACQRNSKRWWRRNPMCSTFMFTGTQAAIMRDQVQVPVGPDSDTCQSCSPPALIIPFCSSFLPTVEWTRGVDGELGRHPCAPADGGGVHFRTGTANMAHLQQVSLSLWQLRSAPVRAGRATGCRNRAA